MEYNALYGFFEEETQLNELGWCSSPLKRLGEQRDFMFIHESLYEFFVAEKMVNELLYGRNSISFDNSGSKMQQRGPKPLSEQGLEDVSQLAIAQRLLDGADDAAIIQFMSDRVVQGLHPHQACLEHDERYKALCDLLLCLVLQHSRGVMDNKEEGKMKMKGKWWTGNKKKRGRMEAKAVGGEADVSIAAANAMTVLVAADYCFSDMDLSGVSIPGAYLVGGLFHHTKFDGADLRDVNLSGAFLNEARMSQCLLSGLQLGQLLMLVGHNDPIESVAWSPDGTRLATGSYGEAARIIGPMYRNAQ